jgi:hypothetical protein
MHPCIRASVHPCIRASDLASSVMTRQSDSDRITVTLPSRVFMALRDRADREGRSTSNLAAFLLESALATPKEQSVDRGFKADSGLRGSTAAMP